MTTKIETNTGLTMVERIFDVMDSKWDRENGLVNIMAMQRVDDLGGTFEAAAFWVNSKLEDGSIRFA